MSSSNANTEVANPGSRRCAACKNQRRKCSEDCILAPYFPATDPQRYACVQRIFGASNIARMLQSLPVHERGKAADTMAVEAHRRVQDPVYGCAGVIARLQEEIRAVQSELARTQAQIAVHAGAAAGVVGHPSVDERPGGGAGATTAVAAASRRRADGAGPVPLLLDDVRASDDLFDDDMVI